MGYRNEAVCFGCFLLKEVVKSVLLLLTVLKKKISAVKYQISLFSFSESERARVLFVPVPLT